MPIKVEYLVSEHEAYSTTPVIYRVVSMDDLEISREIATFQEVLADSALSAEYLATLKESFLEKVNDALSIEELSEFSSEKLFALADFISYLLDRTNSSRDS